MPSKTPAADLDLRTWMDARGSAGLEIASRFRIVEPLRLDGGWRRMIFAAIEVDGGRAVTLVVPDAGAGNEAQLRDQVEGAIETHRRSGGKRTVAPVGLARDGRYGTVVVYDRFGGERLDERISRTRPMPLTEARPLVDGLLETLAALHEDGVFHGRLRPLNVVFEHGSDGSVSVRIDLLPVDDLPNGGVQSEVVCEGPLSRSVLAFMPPVEPHDLVGSKHLDGRADAYAATTMAYLALSGGTHPRHTHDFLLLLHLQGTHAPTPLAQALGAPVDPAVERFFARGLSRHPEERFASANEALSAWRDATRA